MIPFLDLNAQYRQIKSEVDAAIAEVIANSAFIGGPAVKAFESEFAAYQHAKHCVGVANGTDAIEIVLEALDLPKGSEIIVPANSFIATSEAVTRSGHKVVFADVGDDYTLDVDDVTRRITPSTSAILAVHLYGRPCKLEALSRLAHANGIKVIEDCAQAHGAEIGGHRVGAITQAGSFSFYPGKNLGAYGDGGAIVTNDAELAHRCRMISNHGRLSKYDHEFEGRNSRLDGLQAAILRVKLRHLDRWIAKRNEIALFYSEALCGIGDLVVSAPQPGMRHAYHLFVVQTEQREALGAFLRSNDVQTGIHYPIALPQLKAYAYAGQQHEPMRAVRNARRVLSLPIGEHMSVADAQEVADQITRFYRLSS